VVKVYEEGGSEIQWSGIYKNLWLGEKWLGTFCCIFFRRGIYDKSQKRILIFQFFQNFMLKVKWRVKIIENTKRKYKFQMLFLHKYHLPTFPTNQ
jgi:hypothetical protein